MPEAELGTPSNLPKPGLQRRGSKKSGSFKIKSNREIDERLAKLERRDSENKFGQAHVSSLSSAVDTAMVVNDAESVQGLPWYIINPQHSFMAHWDAVTSLALIFTALATPYEVAFLPAPASATEGLFIVNRLVDLVFIIDICVSFLLMYRRTGSNTFDIQDATQMWETRLERIALNYIKGWFFIDVFSVVPSLFDIVPLAIDQADVAADCNDDRVSPFKLLRLIRGLRLVKLVRLLKASRVLKRLERRNTLPYAWITFTLICFQVLVISHWMACVLGISASFTENKLDTWLAPFGLCYPAVPVLDACGKRLVTCEPPEVVYLYTYYWSLGLVVGFASTPLNGPGSPHYSDGSKAQFRPHEVVLLIFMGLLASALWAWVTAKLVEIIMNSDPDTTEVRACALSINQSA